MVHKATERQADWTKQNSGRTGQSGTAGGLDKTPSGTNREREEEEEEVLLTDCL